MMATVLEAFARFISRQRTRPLPVDVTESAELRVLDTLGISAAAAAAGLHDGVLAMVRDMGGREESSVVGSGVRMPAAQAALVGGTLAHSLDFDDTHLPSIVHPSATIVPTALAVGEALNSDGREIVIAIAIGIETTVRLALGGMPDDAVNEFFERGWHATSICGTLGAAATAAYLAGLDEDAIGDAIAIAASFAGGVLEANRSGGTVKRLHCGWAAHAGINAAQLAGHGFSGPRTAIEGRFGFYRAFVGDRFDPQRAVDGLGDHWEVPGIFYKPYPANHYTHGAIDAALQIKADPSFDVQHVRLIELGSSTAALRTIGEPRPDKIRPKSGYHAQFSGPFTVATALLGGGGLGVWFDDFTDEKARDERILSLAAKVETFVDPEVDRLFPGQFGAVLRVHTDTGHVFEKRVLANRGGPDRPLSRDELRAKFLLNATRLLPAARAEELASAIGRLRDAPRGAATALLGLTAPAL